VLPFAIRVPGFHVFTINLAVLMGGVAGARGHSVPCREAAVEIRSSVPWIGFPVAQAVSGVPVAVFGHVAPVTAQEQEHGVANRVSETEAG
jgi:putative transport protein